MYVFSIDHICSTHLIGAHVLLLFNNLPIIGFNSFKWETNAIVYSLLGANKGFDL